MEHCMHFLFGSGKNKPRVLLAYLDTYNWIYERLTKSDILLETKCKAGQAGTILYN